nr:MAG TPA: hypothetical protein [Caudoviricetes sp.]
MKLRLLNDMPLLLITSLMMDQLLMFGLCASLQHQHLFVYQQIHRRHNCRPIGGGSAEKPHPPASPHHSKISPEWVKTQIRVY